MHKGLKLVLSCTFRKTSAGLPYVLGLTETRYVLGSGQIIAHMKPNPPADPTKINKQKKS